MAEGSGTTSQGETVVLAPDQLEKLADMVAARMAKNPVHIAEALPDPEGNGEGSQKGIEILTLSC